MSHAIPRRLGGALPLALAAALATGPARAGAAGAPEVVARVGATDVTSEEVRSYLETLGPKDRQALARDPALLSQVVRTYLARQAVLQELRSKRWDEASEVRAQLERLREQALVELYLQSVSRPADGYPGEAELRAAYDANLAAFAVPKQYRIAQIVVVLPVGNDEGVEARARKRVDELMRKLRHTGSDFAALASAGSDDKASAARGGEVGWVAEDQLAPGIRAAVSGLAKDGFAEPVRLADGWHVVKLLDVRPAGTRAFAEVRDALAAELRAERARANRQAYLAKLLEQNPPAVNELALARVLSAPR